MEISGNLTFNTLDSEMVINEVENSGRFEYPRNEHWVHMQSAWLIAAWKRLLEFYQVKFLNSLTCIGIRGDTLLLNDLMVLEQFPILLS